jgi:hypothetical protein
MSFVKVEPAVEPLAVAPRIAGEMLNLGKTAIFSLLKSGPLESVLIGGARRITVESIRRVAAQGAPSKKGRRKAARSASQPTQAAPALAAADVASGK